MGKRVFQADKGLLHAAALAEAARDHPRVGKLICGFAGYWRDQRSDSLEVALGGRRAPMIADRNLNSALASGEAARDEAALRAVLASYNDALNGGATSVVRSIFD
jgi:hypothetical protein